ncbi:MAG TPA: MFS transporter [Solirubrobacteraceae bacterium]|nr:MFS transporter [Solirubrobacteraceae bacterium]
MTTTSDPISTPAADPISPPAADAISTPDGATAAATPYRWRWIVLAVVLAAEVIDLMDSTIVNVAGPSIRRDLGGGASTLQWLSAAYTLTFAVLLITGARLGDIFGRRRLFLIGSAGFTAMSAACAAAPSPALEITFRALQGGFGALLIPQGFGMLKEVFPEAEMPKVFATFGPVMGLSAIAAPILAGVLIDANLLGTGWRLVFAINVPVGLFALITAAQVLPRGASHPGVRLDVPGMTLVGLGLVAVIYPLIQGRADGWPGWMFAMLGAGAALLVTFGAYERRRRRSPLIEPTLLRNRTYVAGVAVGLALFATFGGLMLTISLFAQLGEGFSPVHTGLTFAPMTVGMVAAMIGSFALVDRLGRHLLLIGAGLIGAGILALALTATGADHLSTLELSPSLVLIGLGAGFSFGQLFDFILAGVAMDEVGSASGVLNAVQQLANALGVAVLGTVFFSRFGSALPTSALSITAWVALIPLAATFALVFALPMRARAG